MFLKMDQKSLAEQAFRLWGEDLSELYVFDEKKTNLCE